MLRTSEVKRSGAQLSKSPAIGPWHTWQAFQHPAPCMFRQNSPCCIAPQATRCRLRVLQALAAPLKDFKRYHHTTEVTCVTGV